MLLAENEAALIGISSERERKRDIRRPLPKNQGAFWGRARGGPFSRRVESVMALKTSRRSVDDGIAGNREARGGEKRKWQTGCGGIGQGFWHMPAHKTWVTSGKGLRGL